MELTRREILHRLAMLGTGAALPSLSRAATQPTPTGPLTAAPVTITTATAGTVGPAFAGLSYEKSQMALPFFTSQNSAAIAMFKLLGPSLLRIGGNSVDKTTWMPNGKGQTSGQVAPADIDALAGFLKATGWQVLYGTNLATSTAVLAAAEIAYAVKSLGSSLYGIEIGNEPDLYAGNYFPKTWAFSDYLTLWESFAEAIRAQSPTVALTGPVASSNISGFVAPFASAIKGNASMLSDHYYRADGMATTSTVSLLVSQDANIVTQAKAMQAVSQSSGIPYRFAETNSFYNGGAPGVSDTFASALWVIDHLFACAANGAQGINLHGGGSSTGYTPIADMSGVVVGARPEFYGALLFSLAGQGSMLQTTINAGKLNATAYTIQTAAGGLNIILNNKEVTQNLNVTMTLPQAAPSATLLELTAASLTATTGVTIQGASISAAGAFTPGTASSLTVSGMSLKCYVPASSAVLIQVPAPGSATSLQINPGLAAAESIVSAFGSNLASTASVTDSMGVARSATVLYSSASQMNFEIPAGTAAGAATVTIGSSTGTVQIAPVAPSLYTLNAAGLLAAYVVGVSAKNVQTVQNVYTTTNGAVVATPIKILAGSVYYLEIFGTGIRGAGTNVTVTLKGISAPLVYSGPQGISPGLDQVNVSIPTQLIGAGLVNVVLTADGIAANLTNLDFQ
jgi:uncharacterized protein (TIGR03437 family)